VDVIPDLGEEEAKAGGQVSSPVLFGKVTEALKYSHDRIRAHGMH
jgi:hypothetical protein